MIEGLINFESPHVHPIDITPDGNVLVVNHVSDSVSIVDLTSQTVIKTLKTQNEPSDVVFAGSNRAFVAGMGSNNIAVINSNGDRLAHFDVGQPVSR